MKSKRLTNKLIHYIPRLRQYIERNEQQQLELRNTIKQLEERNNAWEAEVRAMRRDGESLHILWPVAKEDLIKADYSRVTEPKRHVAKKSPFTIAWVIPPLGETSGGHTTIFRIIQYLESKGHTCVAYVYDPMNTSSASQTKERLGMLPKVKARVHYNQAIGSCDAVFATGWTTAYPVFNYGGTAKKYYFVQDFEPYFEPIGSYSTLAENTYHFNLRGITIGSWLTSKLPKEYGMKCDSIEFGVNTEEFTLQGEKPRKKILFYARPVTPRRGFELGVLALEIFHEQHPEYEINFIGWDISPYNIPFPYVNNGILSLDQLNDLYNECAAGLVLSFTNMSLLPLEMMASGCVPVVNDAEHTRAVSFSDEIKYAASTPAALADALHQAASVKDPQAQATRVSDYAKKFPWTNSIEKVDSILNKELTKK